MKKFISAIVVFMLFAGVVSASSLNGEYNGKPIIKIFSGGKEIIPTNTPAYADGGSTMIPVSVLKELGFQVTWDKTTQSVTITPPEPTVVIKEVVKDVGEVIDQESGAVVTPEESTKPIEPTENKPFNESTTTEPKPDNTATCKAIRDDYDFKVGMLSYQGLKQGPYLLQKHLIEYERDQALSNAGC